MAECLEVIALISGGKDSLYSILHCVQHGHKVVALANLYPTPSPSHCTQEGMSTPVGEEAATDLNSFMFQTVGHSVIPLYSKALGIPLYRRAITGTAVVTDRDYSYAAQDAATSDETENLVPLLQEIMSSHPSANAIVTGAIQSTYQRTRVESVALRLGLIPLSYLWQYPVLPPPTTRTDSVTGLLDDMALAGCEARIIKIASGGISERLLWSDITASRTKRTLIRGLSPFFEHDDLGLRGAVVGEGGEFETIALNGPRAVWKNGRIQVDTDEAQPFIGEGGTSYVQIGSARLICHGDESEEPSGDYASEMTIPVPALLDDEFESIERAINIDLNELRLHQMDFSRTTTPFTRTNVLRNYPGAHYTLKGSSIQVNNIRHSIAQSSLNKLDVAPSAEEQIEDIVTKLPSLLRDISAQHFNNRPISTATMVHTTLVIRSMDMFTTINPIYATLFQPGIPNPPARVTIAAPLPSDIDVLISVILDLGPRQRRRGLHVQSRSYWAPANIGPYSQAIAVPSITQPAEVGPETDSATNLDTIELVHVAGQIPLIPASMKSIEGPFHKRAILSLQHLWRLGQERQVDIWGFGVAFLARRFYSEGDRSSTLSLTGSDEANVAASVWQRRHWIESGLEESDEHEVEDVDIWHSRYNYSAYVQNLETRKSHGRHLRPLPSINQHGIIIPPFVVPEVTSLPRDAAIEWWSIGLSKIYSGKDEDLNFTVDFQTHDTSQFVCSSLTVEKKGTPGQGKVILIAYLIKRRSSTENPGHQREMYTTVDEVITHGLQGLSETRLDLVCGTGYVASHADYLLSNSHSLSTNSGQPSTHSRPQISQSTKMTPLEDAVSVTYTHRLWGHGGRLQKPSDRMDSEREPEAVTELDAAFLLRLTT